MPITDRLTVWDIGLKHPLLASVHYRDTDIRDVGHNKNIEVVTQLTGMQVCHP
jgi:hypothetical protein